MNDYESQLQRPKDAREEVNKKSGLGGTFESRGAE